MKNSALSAYSDHSKWGPLQIAGGYLLLGVLWILFSDKIAAQIAPNAEALSQIGIYKGWGYFLVTAFLLYWLIRRNATRIKETNQKYRLIAENASDVIWLLDPFQSTFKYISPSILKLRGYTAEEVMSQPFKEAFLPEDFERLSQLTMERISLFQAKGSGTVSYVDEIAQPHRDGSIVHTEVTTTYLFNNQNELEILGVMRDITRRKQAEANQRSIEKKYQQLLDQASDGIFIADSTGQYTLVNEEACRLVGYTTDELLSMNMRDLIAPEDLESTPLRLEELHAGKTIISERKLLRRDESRIVCEISGKMLSDGSFQSIVRDITERKVTEDALVRSEKRYRSLFENMSNGYARCQMLYDKDNNPSDFTYLDVNHAFSRLTGLKNVIGKRVSEVIPGIHTSNPELLEIYGRVASTGESEKFESYVPGLATGMWLSVSAYSSEKGFFVAVFETITERKQAEHALRESQARLASIIDSAMDAIISLNADQQIILFNPAAERMFRASAAEVLGQTLDRFIPQRPREMHRGHIRKFGQTNRTSRQMDALDTLICLRTTGEEFPAEITISQAEMTGQKIYTAIVRDITMRKQAEESLRSSYEQLLSFIEQAPLSIAMFDRNMNYLAVSHRWIHDYGRNYLDLVGRNHYDVNPDVPDTWKELYQRGLAGESLKNDDDIWVHDDGTKNWLRWAVSPWKDEQGNIGGIIISAEDISERKRAEVTAFKNELRYHRVLDAMMEGCQIIDFDWKYVYVNSVVAEQGKRNSQELLNHTMMEMYPGIEQTELFHALRRCMEDREPRRMENQFAFPNGNIGWFELSIQPAEEGIFILSTDITERKLAERQLQESERRYRELVQNSNSAILRWKRDGTVAFFNEYAQTLFGYSSEDILGRDVNILLPETESTGGNLTQLAKNIIENPDQFVNLVNENICRDGRRVWMAWTNKPTYDENGNVTEILAVGVDITERKQAETALKQSEQKFSVLFDKSAFAASLSKMTNGSIVDVNESFERMFGYTKQEAIGKTSLELGINPDADGRMRILTELKESNSAHNLELTLQTRSGEARLYSVNVDIVAIDGLNYILNTARDITAQKQAEQEIHKLNMELEQRVLERTAELSEANTLLQAMMDNIPDHIYFKDRESRFIRNSRAQAKLMGLKDPKEAVGKSDFDFFPHAQRAFDGEQEVMKSGQPLLDIEEYVVWPDGRVMWVSTTKVPLRDQEGRTVGIFGISRDITERKHAEEKLQKAKTEMEIANKELESFSYSVSHDLRAPLRAIDGYTNILMEDYESILDEEGKRVCGVISRETKRMGRLIDDLLSFSRMGRREVRFQKIDMKALVNSVLDELLQQNDRSRIELRVTDLPPATGDSAMMRQVWVNLLSNAIKFTSRKERAVIEVDGSENDEGVIYRVRDNGAGFEMEYVNKLFGVFQRLHGESDFDGTGVGLAIVQRVIHRHGGRVWAEAKVDEGATFQFLVPRRNEEV